jgi:hypothetical protein
MSIRAMPVDYQLRTEESMNIVLWILQVLLALAFLAHGLLVLVPPPEIAAQMNAELPRSFWAYQANI